VRSEGARCRSGAIDGRETFGRRRTIRLPSPPKAESVRSRPLAWCMSASDGAGV
jgi:hypothetical protein